MKLARFVAEDGRIAFGQVVGDRLVRPSTGELFGALTFLEPALRVQEFLPPIEPPNIFAIGRNYRGHAEEMKAAVPERPLIFLKATTSLLGHEKTICLPAAAPDEVDFEAELAVVIGRRARRVSAERALDYVLGYTCANDVSARDCQKSDKQWARAKSFDTFCPLGPWLVTPDEFDPDRCRVRSRLNGQVMQDAHTASLIHSCRQLISYLSHQFTLLPGTIILTGTPEGVGVARQPPVFLRPGDVIEIEIDGIGILRNPVAAAD